MSIATPYNATNYAPYVLNRSRNSSKLIGAHEVGGGSRSSEERETKRKRVRQG